MIENYTPSQKRTKKVIASGKNVFLTGKPGTGKTELLRDIIEDYRKRGKKVVVTGSTGMAASNFEDGRTLHSALHWRPGVNYYDYSYCAENIRDTVLIIIDEVSTLDEAINNHFIACLDELIVKPQIIMAGDFYQLPPVKEHRYPFENEKWASLNLEPCILKEVVRQKDAEYIGYLSEAREGNTDCIPYFNEASCKKKIEGAIFLCTRNDLVDKYNKNGIKNLSGSAKEYVALGEVNRVNFDKTRIEKKLIIKKNMRVISLKNDPNGLYQNGSLGTVIGMGDDTIKVYFDNGNIVDVTRAQYQVDGIIRGETEEISQFPLGYGYAITIHKSQGQTFDYVNIMAPNCWEYGQLYVALSRARDIKCMHLVEKITPESLKTDPRVIDYYKNLYKQIAA